jgi:hypothetical protein
VQFSYLACSDGCDFRNGYECHGDFIHSSICQKLESNWQDITEEVQRNIGSVTK